MNSNLPFSPGPTGGTLPDLGSVLTQPVGSGESGNEEHFVPNNFIAIYRSLRTWRYYKDPAIPRVWLELLLRAAYKPTTTCYRKQVVTLSPGQLVVTINDLSASLSVSNKVIRRSLGGLKQTGEIRADQRAGSFLVITINNWPLYQFPNDDEGQTKGHAEGRGEGRLRAGCGQTEGTQNNKENKVKKEKKENKENKKSIKGARTPFTPPTVEEVQTFATERGYNWLDAEAFVAHYARSGWKLKGGVPMVDWKATVVTWKKYQDKFPPPHNGHQQRALSADEKADLEYQRMKKELHELYGR